MVNFVSIIHSDCQAIKETEFEELFCYISTRAQNVLKNFNVKDINGLLRISHDDLAHACGCGKKTVDEIEALRLRLLPPTKKPLVENKNYKFIFNAPKEITIFDQLVNRLTIRAQHTLERLGVKDVSDLLNLKQEAIARTKNCGRKTVAEIEDFQLWLQFQLRHDSLRDDVDYEIDNHIFKHQIPADQNVIENGLCKLIFEDAPKEVFEAIKGRLSVRGAKSLIYLDVSNLKAFMKLDRKRILLCRKCGVKTADEIERLQTDLANFVRDLAKNNNYVYPNQLLTAPCLAGIPVDQTNTANQNGIMIDIENPASWLYGWIKSLARSQKFAHVFMLRKGMLGEPPKTLELIRDDLGGITRERVRQMEKAVEKKISAPYQQQRLRPLFEAAVALVQHKGGMVGLSDLTKELFCRGKDGDQLKYASELITFFSEFKIWKDCGLILEEDGVVKIENSQLIIRQLASELEEIASSSADDKIDRDLWSIDRERLKNCLTEYITSLSGPKPVENMSEALLDAILKQCKHVVRPHKNRVYSFDLWKIRFGKINQMLETILYQFREPTHFTKIAEVAQKWRPELSERNVHTALDHNSFALLWDRGTFIHKDNVIIPLSLIRDVEHWLLEKLKGDVPIISVYGAFMHFYNRCERAALPNEISLYSCLRQSANPELEYPRLPCVYLKKDFIERIPIPLAIEDYIRDAGGPLSQQELRTFWIDNVFLKDSQFTQLCLRIPNVIRTTNWGYLHLDNLELDQDSMLTLIQYTQEILTKEEHCSVDKIYRDKGVTCKAAGIDDPMMLYSLLQYFADELFSLVGYPRVALSLDSKERNRHTIRRHVLDFVRDSGKPCTYEVLEKRFVDELGYKEQQVYTIIQDPEIFLYHPGCVVHQHSLAWDKSKQNALEDAANQIYRDVIRAGMLFGRVSHLVESKDIPQLPSGFYWSRAMIADMLMKGGKYLVLGNAKEAFLPRDNDLNIHNFETLIQKQLNCEWGGAANLKAFENTLRESGIIKNHITPIMLGAGQTVVIKNGEIILKELLIDAQRP